MDFQATVFRMESVREISWSLLGVVKRKYKTDKDVTHYNSLWGKSYLQAINISSINKFSNNCTYFFPYCMQLSIRGELICL